VLICVHPWFWRRGNAALPGIETSSGGAAAPPYRAFLPCYYQSSGFRSKLRHSITPELQPHVKIKITSKIKIKKSRSVHG